MPYAQLDYPKKKITLEVNSEVEKSWRANACRKEPWTVEFIEAIPQGAWFVDAGANVGSYSLVATACGLNVLAIEPSFSNYAALCRNYAANGWLDRVLAVHAALGLNNGSEWLHYGDLRPGAAGHQMGGETKVSHHKQRVMVWSLDSLVESLRMKPPLYLKVDVDGGEGNVLMGARNLLREGIEGLMLEMPLQMERPITEGLEKAGWKLAERFTQREGQTIAGICYGRFARA